MICNNVNRNFIESFVFLCFRGKRTENLHNHKYSKTQSHTKVNYTLLFFTTLMFVAPLSYNLAQSNRSTLNKGVDKYEEKKYADAEVDFRKVIESSPKNFEANFNLGTSYYKQEKYEDAIKSFTSSLETAKDNESRAKVFHNIGNSLLKSNKLEQSVEAYKNALKFNPNDQDTKYNLSYALELLKNKDKDKNKQDKNDQNKKDQNKQDQQQQNQNQDQQNKDQQKQDQQQQQPQDQNAKQDNTKQQQQPKEQKISKDEAQRILDALKNNEKDLQKQLRKVKAKVRKTDKDW
jgi:Ca-activated chloride channel homolog